MKKVTDSCALAATGDYADFQFLDKILDSLMYVVCVEGMGELGLERRVHV